MANILLLVAQKGFQSLEYGDTKKELEAAGHTVTTGSVTQGVAVSHVGEEVPVGVALHDVRVGLYDAIFAIGGPGALLSLDNEEVARIFTEAKAQGAMPYGAICIAPRILAKAGVLEGLHATGWDNDGKLESIFSNNGVLYTRLPVVADGRVVTADGPMSAKGFGRKINELLSLGGQAKT
jgi:putative intracellular protease/amidase